MHHNWPYGLYAILAILSCALPLFGPAAAIIGICGVVVSNFMSLCRFISEERAHRKTIQNEGRQ